MKRIPIFLISTILMVFIFGTSALASSPGSEGVQQSVTVKGTVVDSNNDPLVGVSVFVVGASSGAVTT